MKIYTKTGDAGQTSLIGGRRVDKHHARVQAYGGVDELNAAIGWAIVPCDDSGLADELRRSQRDLFVIGAELATDDDGSPPARVDTQTVERLENWLDRAWGQLPELHDFVLPGGGESAARLHFARTICRRAERAVVALNQSEPVGECVLSYLNRLGDLLFAYARLANQLEQVPDTIWAPPKRNT